MPVSRRFSVGVRGCVAVALTLVTGAAHADLAACIAASEQALSLRHAGHLREARTQMAECASPSCPDELRAECSKRMDALNDAMPSLVVGAKDGSGNDLLAAEVTIDGVKVATTLDGRPIDLDPGEHVVRVSVDGLPPAERKLVLGEGEKARHETFVLGEPPRPLPPPPAPAPEPVAPRWGTRRTVAVTSGALGLVGLGVGGAFGALASSEWSSSKSATTLQGSCASAASCPAHATAVSDHDTAVTYATVSTVGIAVGAALVVTGLVVWLTAPARASSTGTGRLRVAPTAERGGGTLTVLGEF
jgi:hypothetical protein